MTELLALGAVLSWALGQLAARRLEWRASAPDAALGLLVLLVLVQLAVGPGPLVAWALGAAGASAGAPPALPSSWGVGTVSRSQTVRSLLLFLTYAAVYWVLVQAIRRRSRLELLVRVLVGLGAVLAFAGLLDYASRGAWLARLRDPALPGRLTSTFVNPDHFAAWLNMLICLGVGDLLGRARRARRDPVPLRRALASRQAREDLIRRYLPFVGLGLMAVALVFTLSRGGILSLLATLAAMLAVAGALGRTRWTLVVLGALLAVTLGLGAWIGLEPVVARFQQDSLRQRWIQAVSSLGMLQSFPVLGVGLGAYRDAYARYQPVELSAGKTFFPHAHDDWLQLAIELGAAGALLAVWAGARVLRDLAAAHLLGRGRCPVGAGEDHGAQRHDLASVALGLGGLAGALALAIHSLVDFGARIPATGALGAACLAIATVALHTRFAPGGGRYLARVRVRPLPPGRLLPALGAAVAVGAAALLALLIVSPPLADARLRAAVAARDPGEVDRALRWLPRDPDALRVRGRLRLAAADRLWSTGVGPDGRLSPTWEDRRAPAGSLVAGAIGDLRAAVAARPTDPYLQEQLAWAHAGAALIQADRAADHRSAALSAMGRALALAPENPYLHRSTAVIAAAEPGPRVELALASGRRAIERDPGLTEDLVRRLLALGLPADGWLMLAPDTARHRLRLGAALESQGLDAEAAAVYRAAAERASADLAPAARWLAAQAFLRLGDPAAAAGEMDVALGPAGDNPELHLTMARALSASGDARALDGYRRAVVLADARWQRPAPGSPFGAVDPPVEAMIGRHLGAPSDLGPVRYRRALAEYLVERRLWEPALRALDEVLAARPGDAVAHFARGRALLALDARSQALDALRRAVALDPRAVAYRLPLADLLWATEQYHQAMNEWRDVIAIAPGHVEARLRLAAAHRKAGEPVEALRQYQRVLEIDPGNAAARRALQGGSRG